MIAQPGLRYAQADALIRSLLLDETFSALSLAERTAVQQRILTEIKGRMLEDIVLLETKLANPKKQVFVLQFPVGEFDMVVFDPEVGSCRIFEIKHSEKAAPQQYLSLIHTCSDPGRSTTALTWTRSAPTARKRSPNCSLTRASSAGCG